MAKENARFISTSVSGQIINLLPNLVTVYNIKTGKYLFVSSAVVQIQDYGIDIDKHHLSKIFSRFYRVADTNEKTFPGLGIGLFIANEIIKRHCGKMSVASTKREGSLFSFTLPYKKSNL